mmetsp:Transcript_35491/g.68296  ORF Transcript_35491/g.68296 Transcript_35491/m.68296 type:complete len:385 (-) Transcript_35491:320-1474(-)
MRALLLPACVLLISAHRFLALQTTGVNFSGANPSSQSPRPVRALLPSPSPSLLQPALPPLLPTSPPQPPLPPPFPASPGFKNAYSAADILHELELQQADGLPVSLELPMKSYRLGGTELGLRGGNLTLVGTGPDGATIDAQNLSRAFLVHKAGRLHLRSINIANGVAPSDGGGGLLIGNASAAILVNCTISSCTAEDGLAGGGVRAFGRSTLTLIDCKIISCKANNGGGVSVWAYCSVELMNSLVRNCIASGVVNTFGGGVCGEGSSFLTLTNSAIIDCIANGTRQTLGGGLFLMGSWVTFENSAVYSCLATGRSSTKGGGMFIGAYPTSSRPALINSLLIDCAASGFIDTSGGGLFVDDSKSLTLQASTVSNCVASGTSHTVR